MAAWARYINLIRLSPFIWKSERIIATTRDVCVCVDVWILQGNSVWKHGSTPALLLEDGRFLAHVHVLLINSFFAHTSVISFPFLMTHMHNTEWTYHIPNNIQYVLIFKIKSTFPAWPQSEAPPTQLMGPVDKLHGIIFHFPYTPLHAPMFILTLNFFVIGSLCSPVSISQIEQAFKGTKPTLFGL